MIRVAVLLCLALPAHAQTVDPAPYRAGFEACLAQPQTSQEEHRACVGQVSATCMEDTGYSTAEMSGCIGLEIRLWDDLLNAEWPRHRDVAKGLGDAGKQTGDTALTDPDDLLLTAQRAWIAYRDADCAAAGARFTGGTMAILVRGSCRLDHTANRVLDLRAQWEAY